MDNPFMATCLLLNQRDKNRAIGISQDTLFLRGLSAYALQSVQSDVKAELERMARAAFLKAMIEEYQKLAKRLTDHIMANIEDRDTRNEGVYVMTKIETLVNQMGEELDVLWQH